MNYLAHILLSGTDSQIQIGNFIGDFVKGSQFNNFPERMQKGIVLHRKIDYFTDNHIIVKQTVAILRPTFGRYSGIITDMYFDYFLARNFKLFSSQRSLRFFTYRFYFIALLNYNYLPDRVKRFIFHFIFTNRLQRYSSINGLKTSLNIMSIHKVTALYPDKIIEFLLQNQIELENQFLLFFPDLKEFTTKELLKP